jgi:hypothetical protein
LDFFCFVGAVFSFSFLLFLSVIYFYFLFIFRAEPPETQQGRAGRHGTVNLTPSRPPDLTDPSRAGWVNPALDP